MKIQGIQQNNDLAGWIPERMYRGRCIGTKATDKNSSGHPMMTLDCEIIEPEAFELNGQNKICAGRKFNLYLIFNPNKDGWASQAQAVQCMTNLGLDVVGDDGAITVDTDLHETYFKGLEFDIPLAAEEDFKKYMSGSDKGKPILDGEGQKISAGWKIRANPSDIGENCRPVRNEEVANRPY